jgi:hypothetical protein
MAEVIMLRTIVVIAVFFGTSAAYAETAAPESENGRFTFSQVQDSLVRLDTRTGQVSTCAKRASGWACLAVPDERAALESEIARLQSENAGLKKQMMARGMLPGQNRESQKGDTADKKPQLELKLPNDADLDRVMTFMEKIWRRLIEMVQNVQRDLDKKG